MDSIPLVCKICPEQPRYSDVSHLLTHISSKGHLYQSKNAQLRSHHDPAIGLQLEAYNEWYDRYHIEALLAQRIAQKDSKVAKSRSKQQKDPASLPVKKEEPQQKPKRQPVRRRKPAKPAPGDPIDPQLSLFIEPGDRSRWSGRTSHSQEPPPFDRAPLHQGRIAPRGSQTPAISIPSTQESPDKTGEQRPVIKSDMDEDDDVGWFYAPSPRKTSYPDPTTLAGSYTITPTPTPSLRPSLSKVSTPSRGSRSGQSPQAKGDLETHFLKLKGLQYPGMALFDSASPNSQRMRNQKKEHSLLAQMEHAAARVEPMEQIYFPQWTLKKERVITGNVESSPTQETTPKPKRRRGKPGRAILGEISTNIPAVRNPSQSAKHTSPAKGIKIEEVEDPFVSRAVATKGLSDTQSFHIRAKRNHEETTEWRLNTGLPNFAAAPKLSVFRDAKPSGPHPIQPTSNARSLKASDTFLRPQTTLSSKNGVPGASLRPDITDPGRSMSRSQDGLGEPVRKAGITRAPIASTFRRADPAKENVEPILDTAGRIVDENHHLPMERITQRYFSVSGNNPPQFFDSLPPQMDFGGLADHRFQSSSFNPLNPGNWQLQHMSYIPYRDPGDSLMAQSICDRFGTRTHFQGPTQYIQASALHPAAFKSAQAEE